MRIHRLVASALLAGALLAPSFAAGPVGLAAPDVQLVPLGGTGAPQTGAFTPSSGGSTLDAEFAGFTESDAGPAPFSGTIGARSLSKGEHQGEAAEDAPSAESRPQITTSFQGLNHFQQRFARGGNQFSVEPPDQALCVGNGFVVEAVNDVLNVYNPAGKSVLPDNTATNIVSGFPTDVNHAVDLNSFLGYAPAIDRAHRNVRGPEVTDPSCLFDAATQRFFVVVLTLDIDPATGRLTHVYHIDLAVSQTANPTGAWNIYRVNVSNDGTNAGGVNPCPCLGDYPHIGADANGFYITTNAYPFCPGCAQCKAAGNCDGFDGAQIYAFSKKQLAAGATRVSMMHIDTFGTVRLPSDAGPTQPGFTLWPAQSPGTDSFELANRGTEYFLSSNAADEANVPVKGSGGPGTSRQLIVWSITNTASLDTATPALNLSNRVLGVGQYAVPPRQQQPRSGKSPGRDAPQGFCINNTTTPTIAGVGCWNLLFNPPAPAHNEVVSAPDSNDTRMQQVTFANGKLLGALDTAVTVGGANRAGIEWFIVNPQANATANATANNDGAGAGDDASVERQGYLAAAGTDFTYPAIGVTASGRGVMAFTHTGNAAFPSAAFAPIDAVAGVGAWADVPGGGGAAPDDGFTSYKSQVGNPPRTRWGDYGAAAVDGNAVWIASEYIASACNYTDWGGQFFTDGDSTDNKLGTCAASPGAPGKRSALANWSTRISRAVP